MPGEMFAQSLTPEVRRARSRWTLVGSLCAHAALIAAIVVVPIVTGASVPLVGDRLALFVMPAAPPVPVPPPPPAASAPRPVPVDIRVNAAPVIAADSVPFEPIALPPPGTVGVPGSLAPVNAGGVFEGVLPSTSAVTLGPPPVPTDPIRVGGDIVPPTRISYAPPVYPPIAVQAKVDGTVELEAVIDAAGAVTDVRVLRSIPLLDRAAIEAVRRWRYTPARLNGVPVAVVMTVKVTFTLR